MKRRGSTVIFLLIALGWGTDTAGLLAQDAGGRNGASGANPVELAANRPELNVNEAGLFSVHLRDVPLPDALRMLSQRSQRNITVAQSVTAHVTTDLYGVGFEDALDALLTPNGYVWFSRGKFIHVCKPEEQQAIENANRALEVRIFELSFISAADVTPLISKLLSPQGTLANTPESKVAGVALKPDSFDIALENGLGGKSRAVGEMIVVRDYPEVLDQIAKVVQRLDARPKQVMVEAVILRARLDNKNALGIDFNALAGVDFRTIGSTSIGGTNLTPGPVPPRDFDSGLGAVGTQFTQNVPAGGISIGIITNNVALFIRALEETVNLTIVANPKVLAVNEQPGRVIVGREDGYLTTTVTQTSTVQTVEFLQTGTQILFRPFIGNDGYIRMDIHPEDSSGGLTPQNLPFKDTTEVTANVIVKDGHTLVIGGLFRNVISSRKQQIPWLGNIPGLGLLASGTNDSAGREEVIVLLTPHIIDMDKDSALSAQVQGDVEQFRVLAQRGLMPWGRTRLAQAHYRWALEHYRAGKTKDALWDLEVALWLDPQFIEADRLREELGGRPTEEPDSSVVRGLLRRMVEQDAKPAGSEGATP